MSNVFQQIEQSRSLAAGGASSAAGAASASVASSAAGAASASASSAAAGTVSASAGIPRSFSSPQQNKNLNQQHPTMPGKKKKNKQKIKHKHKVEKMDFSQLRRLVSYMKEEPNLIHLKELTFLKDALPW